MNFSTDAWVILILSFTSWLTAQVIKVIIKLIATKKLSIRTMFSTGGLPSSHTSTVVTLIVTLGIIQNSREGLDYVFVLAVVLGTIVIHDALGVRLEAGKHAKILNNLVADETPETKEQLGFKKDKKLKELLGHKPIEVVAGFLLGILISLIGTAIML